jgi:hypothetical protein
LKRERERERERERGRKYINVMDDDSPVLGEIVIR